MSWCSARSRASTYSWSGRRAQRSRRRSAESLDVWARATTSTWSAGSPSRTRSSVPIDLRALRDGVVQVETAGMLPEAEIAFLDEVFLGSTAILNALLGLLNERVYRRGSTMVHSPLRVCVGACNVLPEDPALAAFADRFLARVFVDPVADDRLEELLEVGRAGDAHREEHAAGLARRGHGPAR